MIAMVRIFRRPSIIPQLSLGLLLVGCVDSTTAEATDPDPPVIAAQANPAPTQVAQIQPQQQGPRGPGAACESDPSPTFTTPFTDMSMIQAILPPAVISGERFKNRSYISIAQDADGAFFEVPIYAPVDSTLVSITYFTQPAIDANDRQILMELYVLDFQVSCEVHYGFDHVDRLVGAVGAAAPPEPAPDTRDAAVYVNVPVKAGDLIGFTRGTPRARNWDWIVTNKAAANVFANPDRYRSQGDLQTLAAGACGYDYFPADIRSQFYALLHGLTDDADSCFAVPDEAGAIAGGWFDQRLEDRDLQNFDPGWAVAIGMAYDQIRINTVDASVRIDADAPTYLDPRGVTSEHCYYSARSRGFAYVRLVTPMELAMAMGNGQCPDQMPTRFTTYYR